MGKDKIVADKLIAQCGAPEGVRASAEVVIAGYPQYLKIFAIDAEGNRYEVFPGEVFHSEFSDTDYQARKEQEDQAQQGALRRK